MYKVISNGKEFNLSSINKHWLKNNTSFNLFDGQKLLARYTIVAESSVIKECFDINRSSLVNSIYKDVVGTLVS